METMLESEAMAILVGAGVSYGRREAALRAAGGALAILEEPEAYAAQLQARGVALVRRAWTDRARMLELDASLGETPDMFHRRVEQTLRILQTERTEACTTDIFQNQGGIHGKGTQNP